MHKTLWQKDCFLIRVFFGNFRKGTHTFDKLSKVTYNNIYFAAILENNK